MRTIKQLAQEALDVQDACNLSAVVHGFSRALSELRQALPGASTASINQHPVCVLWADKIAHLTGTQILGAEKTGRAYEWAMQEVRE